MRAGLLERLSGMSKIVCLCVFRDAVDYLPEFIAHVRDYADSLLFLDDRSNPLASLECRNIIGDEPKASGLISRTGRTGDPFAFESTNRRILLNEALDNGASHVLCLDADERVEKRVLESLRNDAAIGCPCVRVWVRDLWNSENQYRVDGVWGRKNKGIMWPVSAIKNCVSADTGLHQPWLPTPPQPTWGNLYHLGSLSYGDRAARVARHKAADPTNKFQAIGYDYLANEEGLTLETIPEGRGWK